MEQDKAKLISTIRELYGRVVWTHKTHEKDREIYANRAFRDKKINAILISTTTVVLVLGLALGEPVATTVGTISAFLSTLFAVYRLSFSPEDDASLHRQAAKALLKERERLLLLITYAMSSDADIQEIRKRHEATAERITEIYSMTPDTSSEAYNKASRSLNVGEELTFSDKELDRLLPAELRLSTPSVVNTQQQQNTISSATSKKSTS
jgi:hypothetical protein